MIDKRVRYHYSEVGIVPAVTSRINSRAKVNPYYGCRELPDDIHFPIFTAPMSSVVNEENYDDWKKSRVLPIIPRTTDIKVRSSFSRKGAWVAWSLQEFIKYFVNWNHKEKNSYPPMVNPYGPTNILIDIANGHMSTLLRAVKTVKTTYKMLEKRLNIMVGNIANPETYAQYCDAGVDYVRVSIGTGSQCITSANTGVHYPIASLLDEINTAKQERIAYRLPYAKVVADGGINRYDYVIKALALGADYVMIGSLFAGMFESAADYMEQEVFEDGTMKFGIFEQHLDDLKEMLYPTQEEPVEDPNDPEEPVEPIAKSVWTIEGVECPLQTDEEGFGFIEYNGAKYEIMMDEDAEQVPENCYVIIPLEDGNYKFSNYGEVKEKVEEDENPENPEEPSTIPTTPLVPSTPTFTIEQHGEFVKTIMKKTYEGVDYDVFCKLETGELFFFDTNTPEEFIWMKPYDAVEEGGNTTTDPDPENPDTPENPVIELDMEPWKIGGVMYDVQLDEDGKTRYMMVSIDGELVKTIIKTDYAGDYVSKYTPEGEAKIRDHGHTYEAPEVDIDDEEWLSDDIEVPSEDDQNVINYAACNPEKCNCNKADDDNAEELEEFAYGLTKEEAEDFISLFDWESEDECLIVKDVEKFKNMPEQYKRAFLSLVVTAKENYGMSTKRAQKEMGGNGDKSSEGIESLVQVEYTRAQWLDNMKNYLRSAMSYCDAFNLKEFVGKPKLVILSEGDQLYTNK